MSVHVGELVDIDADEIRELIAGMRVKPYEQFSHFTDESRIASYEASELHHYQETGGTVIGARLEGRLAGLASVSILEFDSGFFGIRMGRVHPLLMTDKMHIRDRQRLSELLIERILSEAKTMGIKQLTLRVNPRDQDLVRAFASAGFDFIDVIVTYAIDANMIEESKIRPPRDFIIRTRQDKDFEQLSRIARDSFEKDRFHSDQRFDRRAADSFHSTWIENSLRGIAADEVIVAEMSGKAIGFTTLKFNKDISKALGVRSCSMILSAVDSSVRGKGIYTHMIAGGLRWSRDKADVTDLGTQVDNLPVQRAWCTLGFKPSVYAVTMHWWDQ